MASGGARRAGKLKSRLGEVEQAVGNPRCGQRRHRKMAEAYKGLTTIVEASLAQQLQAVKNRYDQEKSGTGAYPAVRNRQDRKSTQLLTEALTQQATLRRQATTETRSDRSGNAGAQAEAAARQGQTEEERRANVQRVENDILAASARP